MVKPIGPTCNLACEYCYYLSKTALYPETTDYRMSDAVLEAFTRQYIEAQRVPAVTFGWQGGEPTLLGLDFFERALAYQARYRRPGMRVINAFQTNGTLLDAAWGRFLRKHNVLVGLSLDGPRELHDTYRRGRDGGPTFDRVMDGLEILKAHDVAFNVLTTVHAANAPHPLETYRFLRDEVGATFIQFIPIVQWGPDGTLTDRSVTAEQYGTFLTAIFDEWAQRDLGTLSVQIFDVAISVALGRPPGLCVFAETCGTALALEHNGDLYACDHFVTPKYRIGNLVETPLGALVGSRQQRAFGQAKANLPQVCQQCEVRYLCNGGCPKNRRTLVPGELPLNVLCDGYKTFFRHVERPINVIARQMRQRRPLPAIRRRMQRHFATRAEA
jgi:uncharacterized protein